MTKYKVSQLRKQKCWTQETLADKANITARTIQRIETGQEVSLDTLTSISNALSVPVSELFESIEGEKKELEIMHMSKEQVSQYKYRRREVFSTILILCALIVTVMSFLGVKSIELMAGYNIILASMSWISLALLLIGLSFYHVGVRLSKKLDDKYPLTKGADLSK
ncbi:helix-turn-helix domain-containing protein [Lactococcus lactis]|uniref:helix-turn-helix domain-containing protein n=1 Tax=Lactococcus lactis TaxID=1358 RepID=UPI0024185213|nr:helix-turn-helix transcriptional regulator [Lactococcus lactis]MDG4967082.1 helix-turn-helix domain-containing protein [Lactococcus lactis]